MGERVWMISCDWADTAKRLDHRETQGRWIDDWLPFFKNRYHTNLNYYWWKELPVKQAILKGNWFHGKWQDLEGKTRTFRKYVDLIISRHKDTSDLHLSAE